MQQAQIGDSWSGYEHGPLETEATAMTHEDMAQALLRETMPAARPIVRHALADGSVRYACWDADLNAYAGKSCDTAQEAEGLEEQRHLGDCQYHLRLWRNCSAEELRRNMEYYQIA